MKKHTSIVMAAILAIGALLAGCQTEASRQGKEMAQNGENVFTVDIVTGTSAKVVQDAILMALSAHGWTVTKNADGAISAELDMVAKRGIFGKIDITYNDKVITITDSSTDASGERFVPVRWINILKKDFGTNMGAAQ
jgi:hypothetical protein